MADNRFPVQSVKGRKSDYPPSSATGILYFMISLSALRLKYTFTRGSPLIMYTSQQNINRLQVWPNKTDFGPVLRSVLYQKWTSESRRCTRFYPRSSNAWPGEQYPMCLLLLEES